MGHRNHNWNGPGDRRARGGFGGRPGGPPPWVAEMFGQGWVRGVGRHFGGGRGPWQRSGQRARRGDVRAAILDVLHADVEQNLNGYQVIQKIAERTDGAWRPSPGSVYPTIQQLEDEGLLEANESGGRRLLQLSEAGRQYVEEHPDELAATWRPFEEDASTDDRPDLKPVIGQVMSAVWQVMTSGTRQQQAEAAEILAGTRRDLYGLLADGDPES